MNIPLTPMDISSKHKINKKTQVLNDTLDETDFVDISRTFHPNAEENTFFSSGHGTLSRIDHILGHNSNISKFKKIEIISSIFSNHSAMRLDINYKEKSASNINKCRLNNTFLNNQQVIEEIEREIKKFIETNNNENRTTQNLWDAAKAVLRGKFITIQSYPKKQEKHQIDNLTLHQEEKMATTPVFLTREFRGQKSLVGCCPWGCTELDTTEETWHACVHWRRKWQPSPVCLPGESQGQRSLVGCCLWSHRVGHD